MKDKPSQQYLIQELLLFTRPDRPGELPDPMARARETLVSPYQGELREPDTTPEGKADLRMQRNLDGAQRQLDEASEAYARAANAEALWKDLRDFMVAMEEAPQNLRQVVQLLSSTEPYRREAQWERPVRMLGSIARLFTDYKELWSRYVLDARTLDLYFAEQAAVLLRGLGELLVFHTEGRARISGRCRHCGRFIVQNGGYKGRVFCDNGPACKNAFRTRGSQPGHDPLRKQRLASAPVPATFSTDSWEKVQYGGDLRYERLCERCDTVLRLPEITTECPVCGDTFGASDAAEVTSPSR